MTLTIEILSTIYLLYQTSINVTLTKSRTKAAARQNNQTHRQLASIIEDALSSVCDEIQQADRHQPLGKILSDIHKVEFETKLKHLYGNSRLKNKLIIKRNKTQKGYYCTAGTNDRNSNTNAKTHILEAFLLKRTDLLNEIYNRINH